MYKFLSTFLILISISCNNRSGKNNGSVNQNVILKDTISFTYNTHKNISPYLVENDGDLDTAYYQISYPLFDDLGLNTLINPFILVDGDSSIETAAESFILGFNEFVEESSTMNINYPWYKNVKSEVWTNTPLFITLATAVDEYTGGAHGIHYTILSNIDLEKKRKIEINDIIEENKLEQFTKIAERHFRNKENIADSLSLEKDFFFENGTFAINDNFGLTKNSLIIYYNEYEIRPYAEGPTLLEIPYSDIKNILNTKGQQYLNSITQSVN